MKPIPTHQGCFVDWPTRGLDSLCTDQENLRLKKPGKLRLNGRVACVQKQTAEPHENLRTLYPPELFFVGTQLQIERPKLSREGIHHAETNPRQVLHSRFKPTEEIPAQEAGGITLRHLWNEAAVHSSPLPGLRNQVQESTG